MNFVVIGNPENRRVKLFCETVIKSALGNIIIIPYADFLLNQPIPKIPEGSFIKIDSPGENFGVRQMLIAKGISLINTVETNNEIQKEILSEQEDFGLIKKTHAWYLGYCNALNDIDLLINKNHSFKLMNTTADIKLMFNKIACQQYLKEQGINVPKFLPMVRNYDELVETMAQQRLYKVFIKPAHASSGSGIIAFRKTGNKIQAITPIEMVIKDSRLQLYNSLKIKTYFKEKEVAELINAIIKEHVLIEEWLPKATINNLFFDIRVLVIAGKARHLVLRMSKQIITNLHLGNKRGNIQDFIDKIGDKKLIEIKKMAEKTATYFKNSLYMGIDILLTADLKQVFVLEINAFGDLLPNLMDNNETCYEAEINALIKAKK